MGIIILCFFTLILFVLNNSIVINGATEGLLLWYNNVIPVLLPFMLLSGLMVSKIHSYSSEKNISPKYIYSGAIISTFFLGVFCGYPLGAKTASDFVKRNCYPAYVGNILIPLCNNSSPMFIAGYIIHTLLDSKLSFFTAILVIYTPYIIFAIISLIVVHLTGINNHSKEPYSNTHGFFAQNNNQDFIMDSIIQITYVGIYIIICSIIIHFIKIIPSITNIQAALLSGFTEITNGTKKIAECQIFTPKIKTALVLAFTSFGGISAILQTNKVISHSGLSIIYYIIVKSICASGTFFMSMLLI